MPQSQPHPRTTYTSSSTARTESSTELSSKHTQPSWSSASNCYPIQSRQFLTLHQFWRTRSFDPHQQPHSCAESLRRQQLLQLAIHRSSWCRILDCRQHRQHPQNLFGHVAASGLRSQGVPEEHRLRSWQMDLHRREQLDPIGERATRPR